MITNSGKWSLQARSARRYDIFIYGLGFETRSTAVVSHVDEDCKTFALKMPEFRIHAYEKNVRFAKTRQHIVISDFEHFVGETLPTIFRRQDQKSLRIGFDISSVNRIMLTEVVMQIARQARQSDVVEIIYCPAAYAEPSWAFPQIERLGPISPAFSTLGDQTKPLCLILGAGFEAGTSMGIINQLEPRLSYCFWGTGVDSRFDRAAHRANFDFEFGVYNTRVTSYDITDPKGAFSTIESTIFGLSQTYRIIMIPMGPKIFTLLTLLVGVTYLGEIAIWRVQHNRMNSPDSLPNEYCIWSRLDIPQLQSSIMREQEILYSGVWGN